ncbi:MAG TPA: DNA methyltransferase [Candidatus Paceibacterota bacterium]|nr:DNA methyltransferase [Candidatus Paceibacterota bacterium]
MDRREILSQISINKIEEVGINNRSHFLVNGDSLKILQKIPEDCIELIITDPPYNIGLDYGPYSKDRKNRGDYFGECKIWLREIARILKKSGTFYLISYPEINARLLPFIEDELKLRFKRWITWHYPTNIGHSKKNFTRSQRSILFFTKSKDYVFNRQNIIQHYKNPTVKKIKERIKNGSKGRASYDLLGFLDLIELSKGTLDVLDINLLKNVSKDRFNKKHPCQLPLELLKILVKVSSNENDLLLDPFAGTFTLSAVAEELKRNSIGIEINPEYIKLGLKRLGK